MNGKELSAFIVRRLAEIRGRHLLPRLFDPAQAQRFEALRVQYERTLRALSDDSASTLPSNPLYPWGDWAQQIAREFSEGVPTDFLSRSHVRDAMVYVETLCLQDRLAEVREAFGDQTSNWLREDWVGRPTLIDANHLTSANRAHQVSHLAAYRNATGLTPYGEPLDLVVEWGGGFGGLSRVIRRAVEPRTYLILDLPPVLALQFVYLGATVGPTELNLVTARRPTIQSGKINLAPAHLVKSGALELRASVFISTWAITESSADDQAFVSQTEFFGAKQVLIAYALDASNHLTNILKAPEYVLRPITLLAREGHPRHEYAFK